jgi:Mg-chelatase subunit ChlD
VHEGDAARESLDDERRETTSRSALNRHPGFAEISPQVGELDEDAFDRALSEDADTALTLLTDLTGATDEELRARARRLAARILLDVGRRGHSRRNGAHRRTTAPADRVEGDLDLDASLDALVLARATRRPPAIDELRVSAWSTPDTALCLLVDRSGSMSGAQLATAAIGAAACSWRAGIDHSVVAFNQKALVLKAQDEQRSPEAVTDDILKLRGFGPTDLALALRTARAQLDRSRAARRIVVLLSDARPTAGSDPVPLAASLDDLCILAPAADTEDAAALARASGARWAPVAGPAQLPAALRGLLDP